jgi:hypothetical protein
MDKVQKLIDSEYINTAFTKIVKRGFGPGKFPWTVN